MSGKRRSEAPSSDPDEEELQPVKSSRTTITAVTSAPAPASRQTSAQHHHSPTPTVAVKHFYLIHDVVAVISSYLPLEASLSAASVTHLWRLAVFDIAYLESIQLEVKAVKAEKEKEKDAELEAALKSSSEGSDEEKRSGDEKKSKGHPESGDDNASSDISSSDDEDSRSENKKAKRYRKRNKKNAKTGNGKKGSSPKGQKEDDNEIEIESSDLDNEEDEAESEEDGDPGPAQLRFLAKGSRIGARLRPIRANLWLLGPAKARCNFSTFDPFPNKKWHRDADARLISALLLHLFNIYFAFFMSFTQSIIVSAVQVGIWSGMGVLSLAAFGVIWVEEAFSPRAGTGTGKSTNAGTPGFPSLRASRAMAISGSILGTCCSAAGTVLFILATLCMGAESTCSMSAIYWLHIGGWLCLYLPVIVGGVYLAYAFGLYSDREVRNRRKAAKKAGTTPLPDFTRGTLFMIPKKDGTKTKTQPGQYPLSVLMAGLIKMQPLVTASITLVLCLLSTMTCWSLSSTNESGIVAALLLIFIWSTTGYCIMCYQVGIQVETYRYFKRREGYLSFAVFSFFFWCVVAVDVLYVRAHTVKQIYTDPLIAESHCKTAGGQPVADRGSLSILVSDGAEMWEHVHQWPLRAQPHKEHGVTRVGISYPRLFKHKTTGCQLALLDPEPRTAIPPRGLYLLTTWRMWFASRTQGTVIRSDRSSEDDKRLDLWTAYIPQDCPNGFSTDLGCNCTHDSCECPLQGPCRFTDLPPVPTLGSGAFWLLSAILTGVSPIFVLTVLNLQSGRHRRLEARSKRYLMARDLWKKYKV